MVRLQLTLLSAFMALLTGCATTLQARDVQPSDFLAEHRSLLKDDPEDGATLRRYRNPTANLVAYNKILLQPVMIWDGFSSTLSDEQRNELQALADNFYDKLYLKLAKDYELVEKPTPGTMYIQVAITNAEPSWTAAAFVTRVVMQLQAANVLWTFASGKPAFSGEITIEFKVYDAQTGELLVAGADRRVGGLNVLHREVFNSWGDVKNSLEFWTDLAAYRLCVLRGRTSCDQPKA